MDNLQFALALIGGMTGFLGAAWIVAQAIQKTAMNPVYEEKFKNTDNRAGRLDGDIKSIHSRVDALITQVSELRHGLNNQRVVVEGIPNTLMQMLREMGLIRAIGPG